MKEAEKHAIHMRLKSVKPDVFENNEPAIALYEKMGYKITGRVPGDTLQGRVYLQPYHDQEAALIVIWAVSDTLLNKQMLGRVEIGMSVYHLDWISSS
jgi:hypothetical protein